MADFQFDEIYSPRGILYMSLKLSLCTLIAGLTLSFGINSALAQDIHYCQAQPDDQLCNELQQRNADYSAAVSRQEPDTIASFYTEDAQLLIWNSQDTFTGRTGVQQYWAGGFGAGVTGLSLTTIELTAINESDSVLFEHGVYSVAGPDGQTIDNGQYEVSWAKVEGAWELQADVIFSSADQLQANRAGNLSGRKTFSKNLGKL